MRAPAKEVMFAFQAPLIVSVAVNLPCGKERFLSGMRNSNKMTSWRHPAKTSLLLGKLDAEYQQPER